MHEASGTSDLTATTIIFMRFLTLFFLFSSFACAAQHPVAFAKKSELEGVAKQLSRYPILQNSFSDIKKNVDNYIGKDVDVPFQKDPAGGYTHERHKDNYVLVFQAGLLYNLTGDQRYATIVKNILIKYAALNPQLKKHPQATSSSPGHIFWQALNDANWLVYCGLGYDLVRNSLTNEERKTIENGAFKPEVDFITGDLESWFNLIHNHGVWACAGVGIVGIATDNPAYVKMALYGTKGDGKSGFIAQLDQLFSPDGYYTEGPYYVRYALLPFYIFANALNNSNPGLRIFEHRGNILQKALRSGLQQTNTDGTFFPFNDAIKDKDYTTNELVTAIGIAWKAYGPDTGLLTVVRKQDRVLLNDGGAAVAAALSASKNVPPDYPYTSVRYTDGAQGNEGAISYLRAGKGAGLTTLGFKYASHGLSHGHFDELNLILFDKGSEVLQDYGSARFVNIEQKYGGRYLPENTSYASQTIAHNTVVVDEASQFGGKEDEAEKYSAEEVFAGLNGPAQAVLARDVHAYKGVQLSRGLYLLQLPGGNRRMVVDIFRVLSADQHQYDLPFQYKGQVIHTNFAYKANTAMQQAMGRKNGYQFLWKEAEAELHDTIAQFSFLNNGTYYTISSLVDDSARLFFTRTGANDPNFNLRREPSYIIRKKGGNKSFINVIEIHGKYDAVTESSTGATPAVHSIRLLQDDAAMTVVELSVDGKKLIVAQCNNDAGAQSAHSFHAGNENMDWKGPYAVVYEGRKL
jgi:hypothetical protein